MEQKKSSAYSPIRMRPMRQIKTPFPFPEEELADLYLPQERPSGSDIAQRPTNRLAPLPNTDALKQNRPSLGLTPADYKQIDEQLDDTFDYSNMSTVQLMQLSGLMRAISVPIPSVHIQKGPNGTAIAVDAYGQNLLDPTHAIIPEVSTKPVPVWKIWLNNPAVKGILGIAIGALIILLMSRLIDFKATAAVIETSITTPISVLHICLAGLAFTAAFSFRGARWKLFLNSVEKVSVFKVIRIYWIGVFINFLLPVQGGELAKSVMLKRIAGVPISQSLPTVAIDKALDLAPVLIIIAIVPFIPGIHMNITLWLILALVGSILLGLIVVVGLTAWNRKAAITLINFFLRLLPKGLSGKIEGFAMGFVDSLLAGASNPRAFIPAVLLTGMAVTSEGLFAWEGFHAVGLNMGLGMAIFGYTVYTLFSILPTPPAGLGTNEGAKSIVFVSLLGFNAIKVNAMAILVHPVCAILMAVIGIISLRTLGLTLNTILQKQETPKSAQA